MQVREIVGQQGHCLIPVVALGRAQELLLILEDCWSRHPELHDIPVHQTSGIAAQSLGVFQSYIEMMNEGMRAAFQQRNPFDFRHVRHTRGFRAESEVGACVVLATPSMLQSGLSRELFEAWCEDHRNGIIIADFAVQVRLPPLVTKCCFLCVALDKLAIIAGEENTDSMRCGSAAQSFGKACTWEPSFSWVIFGSTPFRTPRTQRNSGYFYHHFCCHPSQEYKNQAIRHLTSLQHTTSLQH
jgi:hypothetical protein